MTDQISPIDVATCAPDRSPSSQERHAARSKPEHSNYSKELEWIEALS